MAPVETRLDKPAAETEALEPRALAVLSELAREGEAHVAFQGLRRRLELHQEQLARTLRRLEREGLVAREDHGYKLTEQGFAALRGKAVHRPRRETLTVLQAVLPPHLAPDAVAAQLSRRWFRGLRWYGHAEAPGEATLTWLAERGNAAVRVHLQGGTVALEVEVPPGGPAGAFAAARGLLAALAELYGLETDGAEGPAGAYGAGAGFAA